MQLGYNITAQSNSVAHTSQSRDNLNIYQPSPTSSITHIFNTNLNPSPSGSFAPLTPQFSELCHNCQRFQQQRLNYESCILNLQKQLSLNKNTIANLEKQIGELKTQQQYFIKTIESIRDTSQVDTLNVAVVSKLDRALRQRSEQLNFANKQIEKLKGWLKEEKTSIFRIQQCVKVKDLVIQNLQKQLEIAKNQLMLRKKGKKIQNPNRQSLQNSEVEQLTKYKNKCIQLQQQIYEMAKQIDTLRHKIKKQQCQQFQQNPSSIVNANTQHQQLDSPIKRLTNLETRIKAKSMSYTSMDSHNYNIRHHQDRFMPNQQEDNSKVQRQIYGECNKNIFQQRFKDIPKNSNTLQSQTKKDQNREKKYRLLSQKCLFLQQEIERLLNKLYPTTSQFQNY